MPPFGGHSSYSRFLWFIFERAVWAAGEYVPPFGRHSVHSQRWSSTWGGGLCGPLDVVWVSSKTLSIRLCHPGKSRGRPCGSPRAYGRAVMAASPQPHFRLGSRFMSFDRYFLQPDPPHFPHFGQSPQFLLPSSADFLDAQNFFLVSQEAY